MPSHEHRRPRRPPERPLTPEQAANIRALARQWRDAWRAEVAAGDRKTNGHAVALPTPRPAKKAGDHAARFAAAVARDAFGRFYWSEQQQGAPIDALKGGRRKRRGRKAPSA
jgi:hypothetical protein